MIKKTVLFLLVMLLMLSFASCVSDKPSQETNPANQANQTTKAEGNDTTPAIHQGEPVPTFTVDWPSEMLPSDFPDLGKVTKAHRSSFSKVATIYWNMVTEEQVEEIVDKLNAYLDYDHAWQDYFYSDGIKYQPGTEDESIRVVIRYMTDASGEIEPNFNPQFFLEISGPGLPDKK